MIHKRLSLRNHLLFRYLFAALMCFVAIPAVEATTVTVDGIAYDLYEDGTAGVGTNRGLVKENLVIPDYITYEGENYPVTQISEQAFYGCYGLIGALTIPNSVTSIGSSAFSGCSGLTSVTIPNSVTSIGRYAFKGCTRLTGTLTIPNSVTEIGDGAFSYCYDGLKEVTIEDGSKTLSFGENVFNNALIETLYLGRYFTCSSSDSSNQPFYEKTSLSTLTIGNSVTWIGQYAFSGCYRLTSVTIPNSVTSIGECAFYHCSGLTGSLTIPNSVKTIESGAFRNCTGLTSVTIGNSVTTIGNYAFYGCSGLTGTLSIPNSVTWIGNDAFSGCSGLTSVSIPNSVTEIGNGAFYECYGLTGSLTIPNSVTTIGSYAFFGCHRLTGALTIPNSVTEIGSAAFCECYGLTSVTIPNSVTKIADGAFDNCTGLTSVTIPNSVTSIGKYAFYDCYGLTSLIIPNSVTKIGSQAFYQCTGLTSVTIPNSVTKIADETFEGCTGLTSVTIGTSVTSIGGSAFEDCTGLTGTLTIPNSVTKIGYGAFSGCTGLTSVTIGNSVTSIGRSAFYGCTFNKVICEAITPPEIGRLNNSAFSDETYNVPLLVPVASIPLYKEAFDWKRFTNILEINPEEVTDIILDKTEATLIIGDNLKLTATVEPENVTNPTITWSSDNVEVATVSEDGTVTAVAVGTANITATCGSASATCRVKVEAIPVEQIILSMTEWSGTVGESVTLSATVLPDDATNKHIVWSSSDEIIATVDDNGLVQLIASGNCIIKATTTDGSDISAECKIVSLPVSGLSEVENDNITTFDVYNMQGEIIRINCDSDELQHLLPGIYIIRNSNYVNKIIIR